MIWGAQHRLDMPFDTSISLFNAVVEISALVNASRFRGSPGSTLQAVLRLASVNDKAIRSAMAAQGRSQETFGGWQAAMLAEPEFDCIAACVDRSIEYIERGRGP
ncbi:hypothetical protein BA190_17965 [Labrys sp. WJW]|nr:hypothetical protein BA190_17965 [Labrys sp. WJW]